MTRTHDPVKRILDACVGIVGELRQLRELKLYGSLGEDHLSPDVALEHSSVLRFAKSSPSLQRVTWIPSRYNGRNLTVWKRCTHTEVEEAPVWLPDPTATLHWTIWLKEYTTAELVERRMQQFWGKERQIPYLGELQMLSRRLYMSQFEQI